MAEALVLLSTVMTVDRDRMTNLCFIRVWWNHLWTWKAKKNLDVIVVHKFEEGTLKAKLCDKGFEVT